jgi:hypothetical protein
VAPACRQEKRTRGSFGAGGAAAGSLVAGVAVVVLREVRGVLLAVVFFGFVVMVQCWFQVSGNARGRGEPTNRFAPRIWGTASTTLAI